VDSACSWRLVIDAFLEGYHVKSLHRESVARFFEESVVFDFAGPHARSVGVRRFRVDTLRPTPQDLCDIRQVASV
jgi:phenylpropionate dioxygenase-like ring-hydroxylating dioxygenase large terminal subunit